MRAILGQSMKNYEKKTNTSTKISAKYYKSFKDETAVKESENRSR